jgi:xanthine dehydrogenase YagR molybdenum-binding subunit
MKFEKAAGPNPIDQMKVVGRATDRIDGPYKTSGRATYAYEWRDVAPNAAYGYILGSAIPKGRIGRMDVSRAKSAPGVVAVVTADNAGKVSKAKGFAAGLLGGPQIEHYDQAIAIVVAETFEQARAAAKLIRVDYLREPGHFDLREQIRTAPPVGANTGEGSAAPPIERTGDFEAAFAAAPVTLDATYSTPDQSHAMMEPHATLAVWRGDELTLWTSNQMLARGVNSLSEILGMPKEKIRLMSPFVGGGFGSKLRVKSDAVMAALAARVARRPVKVALARNQVMNNTGHRAATVQHIRLGAGRDGKLTAIAHESWSGNLPEGRPETATSQTRLLYAGANRLTALRLAVLDLPEGESMRAPGEAPGLMALEIAMDEMAEKLGMDPVQFRIINDTQVDPEKPERPFSSRHLVECLRLGADKFGWSRRHARPGQVRQGRWLVGTGCAAAFRNNILIKSAARVRLDRNGLVTVETDMTDIGTGSYTILAQTAAEMMGVPLHDVQVKLGDSSFPASSGSGGQFGAANSTAGVYAACVKLREAAAAKLGFGPDATFAHGQVRFNGRSAPLRQAAAGGELVGEDAIEYGDIAKEEQQSTFGAHFVEAAVDGATGEVRVRRMLAVCSAGRILNPKSARSQVIGAMTMGVGAALMEDLVVDTRNGLFINHDLAGYEVPVHADIPHQEVIFLDETDPMSTPMKAKGVGELGICGVAAAVSNAVYNACGVRVRDYPVTLDKLIGGLPQTI